jgi:hypothetical protein
MWAAECKKVLQQLKKSPSAIYFLEPVDWKGLGLKDYPQIIKNPMDLGTMTSKLNSYTSQAEFDADFRLIVSNCQTYNAEGSEVYVMAAQLNEEYERLMERIWVEEAKKILTNLKKHPNAYIFLEPVDWKGLGLTDYLKVIKTPMDLGTVGSKLGSDQYASMDAFFDDLYLIWSNCMVYNADGSEVYKMAAQLKAETDKYRSPASPVVTAPAPPSAKSKRKSTAAEPSEEDLADEEEKRREDIVRLGKRFAALQHDYLGGAIRFIYAKCPKAVKMVESGQFEIDFQTIGTDTSCCDSVNQLVKVMLYLQLNPE